MYKEQVYYNEAPIIKIDIKDVLDFCFCPMYYSLKCNNNTISVSDLYDKALHKTFYSYLKALMSNKPMGNSLAVLKYHWGKEWVKEKTRKDIILKSSPFSSTYDNRRISGVKSLINFDALVNDTKQTPILINEPWEVKISNNLYLTGTWEYIREIDIDNNPVIQLMVFYTNNTKAFTKAMLSHDLLATAMQYAFEQTFEDITNQLVYIDTFNNKKHYSIRTERDFKLLKETVISTALCLMNNIKCISMDKKCYYCEFRHTCSSSIGSISDGYTMEYL